MAHPSYLRDKARSMRVEQRLSILEIGARLALPKTTIYYWVKDLPLARPRRANPGQRRGNKRMRAKYRERREEAYRLGVGEFDALAGDPTFRDFVCLYIAEGYKRDRNTVSLCNSDARIVKLAAKWMRAFSRNGVSYQVQHHADQIPAELQCYCAGVLEVEPEEIRLQRKTNSNRLSGRTWRCVNGVCSVRAFDTLFRARLQGWIDCLEDSWV
jgi:hypothetical protein